MDDKNLNENKPPVERDEGRTIYTYDKGGAEETKTAYAARAGAAYESGKPGKSGGWKKGFVIFLIIALVVVVAGVSCSRAVTGFLSPADEETYIYDSDYIAELHLEGTITDGKSGDGYSQDWIMDRIEDLTYDEFDRGIMLYVDSPGGSVYATAEVYKALKYYQEYTENPV